MKLPVFADDGGRRHIHADDAASPGVANRFALKTSKLRPGRCIAEKSVSPVDFHFSPE